MSIELFGEKGLSFFASKSMGEDGSMTADFADMEFDNRSSTAAVIAIIEKRLMMGECLSRSISEIEPNYSVFTYSSLEAWHRSASFSRTSLVLLCARGGESADAETADIVRDLTLARQLGVQIPVAVLSDRQDAGQVLKLIEQGVRCYITSNIPLYMAVRSMQFAIDGGISVPPDSLLCILKSRSQGDVVEDDREVGSFTTRQRDIIKQIEQGKQNKTIAHELRMSEGTVKVHIRNIMKKLNARNRTEIVFRLRKSYPAGLTI